MGCWSGRSLEQTRTSTKKLNRAQIQRLYHNKFSSSILEQEPPKISLCSILDWHLLSRRGNGNTMIYPGARSVKWLNICLFVFKERMPYFPTGFVFRAGGKPVHYEHHSTREILSPWSWHYFSWTFFFCVLILQEICEGENRKKKKKSNSKLYDFYFYNLSKQFRGRSTMGQRDLCIWYKSRKPDLAIFMLVWHGECYQHLTPISSSERCGFGFVALITLMDLCQRSIWHGNCGAEQQQKKHKCCVDRSVLTVRDGIEP